MDRLPSWTGLPCPSCPRSSRAERVCVEETSASKSMIEAPGKLSTLLDQLATGSDGTTGEKS